MTTPGDKLAGTRLPINTSSANPGANTTVHADAAKITVNGAVKIPAEEQNAGSRVTTKKAAVIM